MVNRFAFVFLDSDAPPIELAWCSQRILFKPGYELFKHFLDGLAIKFSDREREICDRNLEAPVGVAVREDREQRRTTTMSQSNRAGSKANLPSHERKRDGVHCCRTDGYRDYAILPQPAGQSSHFVVRACRVDDNDALGEIAILDRDHYAV